MSPLGKRKFEVEYDPPVRLTLDALAEEYGPIITAKENEIHKALQWDADRVGFRSRSRSGCRWIGKTISSHQALVIWFRLGKNHRGHDVAIVNGCRVIDSVKSDRFAAL